MSVKTFIQIIILIIIIIIVGSVYLKYFEPNKNIVEEIIIPESDNNRIEELERKISELELKNINLNKKINKKEINTQQKVLEKIKEKSENKELEKKKSDKKTDNNIKKSEKNTGQNKNQIQNLVKDFEYSSIDQKGNRFRLLANSGKTNIENKNILDLDNVRGEIKSENRDTIFIKSDYAQYKIVNFNSKFYGDVIVNYQDKKITCMNFDINMETNKAIAYNSVEVTDPFSFMKAGIVEFDLKTKDININPESVETEIKVITK